MRSLQRAGADLRRRVEDRALSIATREAVLAAITANPAAGAAVTQQAAAATLRAQLDEPAGLSKGEAALLDELLARLSEA